MRVFEPESLYVITDPRAQKGRSHIEVLTEAIRGGASVVQLRDKDASDEMLIGMGKALRKVCDRFGALFIVNERIEVAQAVGADGIHIGQEDLSPSEARRRLGRDKLLGVSTHTLAQAERAVQEGADYIGVGPIFKTPTKPDYPPVGTELIREVKKSLKIPFVAIGGINLSNAEDVLSSGAYSVAVVRAVVSEENIYDAAGKFRALLKKWQKNSEKKDE